MRPTRSRGFEGGGWNFDYRFRVALSLAGMVLALSPPSRAQIDRAALSGTVTDPSGRVLPRTRVTAVEISTGLDRLSSAAATNFLRNCSRVMGLGACVCAGEEAMGARATAIVTSIERHHAWPNEMRILKF